MINLNQFQDILTKEMSRKEFLQHIGIFLVGAVGIAAVVGHFSKLSTYNPNTSKQISSNSGYGSREYGR